MEHGNGTQFNAYFKSFDNVIIYFSNLSPYYIFSVIVSILAVIFVCWFRNTEKILQGEMAASNDDVTSSEDLQPESDELKPISIKLKESVRNFGNNFVEAVTDEEFLQKDFTGSAQDNVCGRDMMISQKDTPGGDWNFEQFNEEISNMTCTDKWDGDENQSPITIFKKARQAALYDRFTSDLSEQQLQEEKETEASQIAAIWDLLKQQKEQFNIGTEEELHDQLHLYRL